MSFRNFLLVIIFGVIIILTGCNDGSPSGPKSTPTPTSQPGTTLTPTPTLRRGLTPTPTPTPTLVFQGGTGTVDDPYLINTAAELDQIRYGLDKCYKLMADIDLASYPNWKPIGYEDDPFFGHLDGNNHTIRNLTIFRPGMASQGLFGQINYGSELSNIAIQNPNITGYYGVGSLVGTMIFGTVTNCSVTGTTTITSTTGQVGGLIGLESYGTITNSYASVPINTNGYAVGGLIGNNNYGTVTNCYVTGSVQGYSQTGGLIGSSNGTVTNCYSTGNVQGQSETGGLIGMNNGNITNCHASGTITGTSFNNIGGLIGYSNGGNILKCYAAGNVSGINYIGGLVGNCNKGSVSKCYANGNVNGTGSLGGLIGSAYIPIDNSYATGSVTGTDKGGGLVGYLYYTTITNCYSVGSVVASTDRGGLVGYTSSGCIVTSSYYDQNTSGQSDNTGKGLPKTTALMKQQTTFTGWDFATIWNITANTSYPFFREGIGALSIAKTKRR